jgi:hypothetical protein
MDPLGAQALAFPDLLAALVALGVVLWLARLALRIAWKLVVVGTLVVGALWLIEAMSSLPV